MLRQTVIDDEKDFTYPHKFYQFNEVVHGASTPGHSTTITPDFISQKVDDHLRCQSVKRKRKKPA